ncbi:hypothetical protein SARC_12316 [Sphaeroforma arctica JP610]|uniref:Rab3-GAP regulatory subunit N-terminal domain-containing protein n=1 Tax=Sphaeroforma arctica JP610 TaxID=667725 RepID=A0A0L0FEI4_9EUKA|nr:hypothetical protein SARC_12316 [Sphaeroforma arctica JP610]KNC75150.1 hypothetical protein SARC_12316 [Sphaeroforma arctica JP610]|eukprot:XP_014149052.1 hypothetical protein SARC_12316 [Sphaeroforma arctica JP610]
MTRLVYLRVWKGYREAQCGWIEVKEEPQQDTTHPLRSITLLVMLAPRRKLMEVWRVLPTCVRLRAVDVGPYARLVTSVHTTLNTQGKAFVMSDNPFIGSKGTDGKGRTSKVDRRQSYCYVLRGTGVLETVTLSYAEAVAV